eukprot:TRINITY_DN4548_c0_g2_i4.p1 TRINITY_DN4548_c0_g2~~TRINITY_DN4548_c0_g2_i4.p1  ORF type:complete len:358 (-),score=22.12 TRINITY_DN4548_c0_g2_i4:137-1210(-)
MISSMTTSIPEAPDTERTWDARLCLVRDSIHAIRALNLLGDNFTMDQYTKFIRSVIRRSGHELQPLYGLLMQPDLPEQDVPFLSGYRSMGPVRVGNGAFCEPQHYVYGAIILALCGCFVDQRLHVASDSKLLSDLEILGHKALELYRTPDAGIWLLRGCRRVHTISSVMCWVACDRLSFIWSYLNNCIKARYWRKKADHIKKYIMERAWNAKKRSFVQCLEGESDDVDASLLLLAELRFIEPTDMKYIMTVEAIGRTLLHGKFLHRYQECDDFGAPTTAFVSCTLWYIDALALIGRNDEARELFDNILAQCNHVGLLSEDIDPTTGELWGNFPHTWTMCGLISSAIKLSRSWESVGL